MQYDPTDRRFCRPLKRSKRRGHHPAGKNPTCTPLPEPANFLKHRFPLLVEHHPLLGTQRVSVQTSFFRSLGHLSALYGLPAADYNDQPFPLNIYYAFEAAGTWIRHNVSNTGLLLTGTEQGMVCLATSQHFYTGHTLYYIPCEPVARLLEKNGKDQFTLLLLSVFVYLYRIVNVAWFDDTGSYLDQAHLQLMDWINSAEDEISSEDLDALQGASGQWQQGAAHLTKVLSDTIHLHSFKERLLAFKPADEKGRLLRRVATAAFKLYRQYPSRSFYDQIPVQEDAEDEFGHYPMSLDMYLSFIWNVKGKLAEQLLDYIDADLQEYVGVSEPVAYQLFDSPQTSISDGHDFSRRLLSLISSLCELLYDLS